MTTQQTGAPAPAPDFFVSYTKDDRTWAEWIAWQLEEAGYHIVIQAWDSLPGHDFVKWMAQNIQSAQHVLAVLSPAYEGAASLAVPEWTAAIGRDPTGEHGIFIPVRVTDFSPGGLFGTRGYVDLVGKDEEAARAALLEGVRQRRLEPAAEPPFPGHPGAPTTAEPGQRAPAAPSPPRFPGPDPPGPFDRVRAAMLQLDEQSERFRTYPLLGYDLHAFLDYTFFPKVRDSLARLECINSAEWRDTGWAMEFSDIRDQAMRKLTRAEACRGGELTQRITELLRTLKRLRDKVASRYPQMLDG